MDYTSLWEAFAGGGTWAEGSIGAQTDYGARTTEFYDEIVGPAFGYDTDLDTAGLQGGFGTDYTGLMANIYRYALEEGEKEFRMSIGDTYVRGDAADPFAWENISRMKTYEDVIGEAQQMLEGELYHRGDQLGGSTGAAYGEGVAGAKSAYQAGMLTAREDISHEGLTSGIALQSGTSGATLRSGTATGQAEDVLVEAYRDARALSGAQAKTKEKTELEMQTSLDTALDTYLDIIRREKEDWYNDVMGNIVKVQGMGTEDDPSTVFTSARTDWDASQYGGLTYADTAADLKTQVDRGFTGEGICGIGELWDGTSCVAIEGLTKNEYGDLVGTGGGLYPGCTVTSADNYNPHAETDNGSCFYDDTVTCPEGQEIGPDGDCVLLDIEQQCPHGQIKTEGGDCIDDPRLPCTLECPSGQQLNPVHCICYDIWDYDRPGKEFS